jgi:hypothetical protein
LTSFANSLPKLLLEVLVVVGFRFARIALALLNQIAFASEPAYILAAGSLYRLRQLLRQEPLCASFYRQQTTNRHRVGLMKQMG